MVWVRGDHDIVTRVHLSGTLAQAVRLDDSDIVVDLSGVTFMDASTIGVLVDARNRLLARSRSLAFRAPSNRARRLLDVCGLAFLIDGHPALARPLVATGLDSSYRSSPVVVDAERELVPSHMGMAPRHRPRG